MKKHLFFDLDGTLTDSMPGIVKSVQYALKHYGIEVEDLNGTVRRRGIYAAGADRRRQKALCCNFEAGMDGKAGLEAVGILYGYGDRAELEEDGAEWIAESTQSLTKLLLKL